jgi:hypothetical protein
MASEPYRQTLAVAHSRRTAKWYNQTATGDIPETRRKFCGGATWADDQSSYNV